MKPVAPIAVDLAAVPRPVVVAARPGLIDLRTAPSAMEQRFLPKRARP